MSIRRIFLISIAFACTACQTVQTTQPGAVGVERKQLMLVSEETVEKGAQEAYRQELEKARNQRALNADSATYQRVQRISKKLIPHTAVFRPDAAQWNWEINVQTSKDVNAYCMPGGKIMVYLLQRPAPCVGRLRASLMRDPSGSAAGLHNFRRLEARMI
jgi:predicted Zn-dependent protease